VDFSVALELRRRRKISSDQESQECVCFSKDARTLAIVLRSSVLSCVCKVSIPSSGHWTSNCVGHLNIDEYRKYHSPIMLSSRSVSALSGSEWSGS